MSAYVVSIDGTVEGRSLRNGVDTAVVFAGSSADAKAIAEASFAYTQPAVWAGATATACAAAADYTGWKLRARVIDLSGVTVVDASYTGVVSDTIDLMAAGLVIALNATAPIAGAAYNSSTQVVKIAEITDALGDHTTIVEMYPANRAQDVAIPGYIVSKVDGGAGSDALTATLCADAYTVAKVVAKVARS